MYITNCFSLLSIFCISSSKIIHDIAGDNYLDNATTIDLTQSGAETTLFVRLCEWSIMNGPKTIVNMTRYCYCTKSKANDVYDNSCSVPGPTLKMHDNTVINVTVINELNGSTIFYNQSSEHWNDYKDMDITKLKISLPLTYIPLSIINRSTFI